jgi:hypothetical protein
MLKLAAAAAQRRTSREELGGHGQAELRNSDNANHGDETNEKSVFNQRCAFLILADRVDQLKGLRHY